MISNQIVACVIDSFLSELDLLRCLTYNCLKVEYLDRGLCKFDSMFIFARVLSTNDVV